MKGFDIRKMIYPVCVLVLCNLLFGSILLNAVPLIPEGVTYRLQKNQPGISARQFFDVYGEGVIGFLSRPVLFSGQGQNNNISAGYIQGNIPAFLGAELLYGSWKLEPGEILIGESLAVQLFKRNDCLGAGLTLENSEYTVVGVYRPKGGFLREISENGKDLVLLTLKEAPEEWPVETLLLQGTRKITSENAHLLDKHCEGKLEQSYCTEEHNNMRRMLKQIPYLQVVLLAVWAVFVGIFRIVYRTRKLYEEVAQKQAERSAWIKCAISILLWCAAVMIAARFLLFDLYIPDGLFAEQAQIVSITPYIRGIKEFFQWHNQELPALWYIKLAYLSTLFESVLLIFTLKNWGSVLHSIRRKGWHT